MGLLKVDLRVLIFLRQWMTGRLSIQDKQCVLVVYMNFAKADDVVSHKKSFLRLYSYWIRDNLLSWLQELFLEELIEQKLVQQCPVLKICLVESCKAVLLARWCLSLLLITCWYLSTFGIVVNFFADDLKMYVRVVNDVSVVILQSAIDALVVWSSTWQLSPWMTLNRLPLHASWE